MSRPRMLRRIALRIAAGALLLVALGGPTPGYVGSCDASGPRVAEPQQFCVDKESAVCAHEYAGGRADGDAYNICAGRIEATCRGAMWSNGCAPSPETAGACLGALRDTTRLGTPAGMIVECYMESLCGGSPLVSPDDDGI